MSDLNFGISFRRVDLWRMLAALLPCLSESATATSRRPQAFKQFRTSADLVHAVTPSCSRKMPIIFREQVALDVHPRPGDALYSSWMKFRGSGQRFRTSKANGSNIAQA